MSEQNIKNKQIDSLKDLSEKDLSATKLRKQPPKTMLFGVALSKGLEDEK